MYVGERWDGRHGLHGAYPAGGTDTQYYTIGSPPVILMKIMVI